MMCVRCPESTYVCRVQTAKKMMMPKTKLTTSLIIGCLLAAVRAQERKELTTAANFDIHKYVSAKWFTHQQVETVYVPDIQNYCVSAEYTILDKPTFFGYTMTMDMYTEFVSGNGKTQKLCAQNSDPDMPSKLSVAPCFLPKFAAGAYWVLAYDEPDGYALVSGGPPTNKKAGRILAMTRSRQVSL